MNAFTAPAGFAGAFPHRGPHRAAGQRVQLVTVRQVALLTAKQGCVDRARLIFVAALALLRVGIIGLGRSCAEDTPFDEALLPPRGEIVDRNGAPLARAFPAYSLWFNPDALGEGEAALIKPAAQVARELKAIFPALDARKVARQLAAGKGVYLRKRVLPEEANRVLRIGELALEMPEEIDRHYPQGSMGAHILGYVDAEDTAASAWAVLDKAADRAQLTRRRRVQQAT